MFPKAVFIIFKRTEAPVCKKSQVVVPFLLFPLAIVDGAWWRVGSGGGYSPGKLSHVDWRNTRISHTETAMHTDAITARNESGPLRQEPMTNAFWGAHGTPDKPAISGSLLNKAQVRREQKEKGGADPFGSKVWNTLSEDYCQVIIGCQKGKLPSGLTHMQTHCEI